VVKVKIDSGLYERAVRAAEAAGYSSVDEFIAHCIESGIGKAKTDDAEDPVTDRLRGLGYLE
jgi:hypothetical protein